MEIPEDRPAVQRYGDASGDEHDATDGQSADGDEHDAADGQSAEILLEIVLQATLFFPIFKLRPGFRRTDDRQKCDAPARSVRLCEIQVRVPVPIPVVLVEEDKAAAVGASRCYFTELFL